MIYKLIEAPDIEPLTIDEVKEHLRVDNDDDDTLIESLITTARMMVEEYTALQLLPSTWELYLDSFPNEILINKTPIQEISSLKYYDSSNVLTTLDANLYDVDIIGQPARVKSVSTSSFPCSYIRLNSVVCNFIAGYEDAASIPAPLKQAMLMIIGHLFEHREDVAIGVSVNEMPMASKYLMNPYRVFIFS